MPAPPLTDAQLKDVVNAIKQAGGNQTKAGILLGVNRNTIASRVAEARRRGLFTTSMEDDFKGRPAVMARLSDDSLSVEGDKAELTKTTDQRVRTLADLIRVCEVDTTEWEVERFVCNKWEMGAVGKDAEIVVTPLYQIKAWLRRKVMVIAVRKELASLKAAGLKAARPRAVVKRKPVVGNLLEISIPDLHVGKFAWARETGWEHYDSNIAARVFREALAALIARTSGIKFERVLFVIGNDILHADTKQGTTTAGTQLDIDSRFHRNFSIVRGTVTEAIEQLREIAPVDALMVPGNHDTLSVWHLGDSLECLYAKCKDVTIDNAPTMRKYYQFGSVMLMFTHGNKGKLADYPLVMAAEQPEMFGATRHREAHTGDKHQLRVQEHHGVKVRISPALCPPDAWHAEHQFVGQGRSAEAFVWNREEGLIGTAYYTVPPPPKEG